MLLKRVLFVFVLLALLSGCDNPVLDVFREPVPVVQAVPEHVWEEIAFFRERILRSIKRSREILPTDKNLAELEAEQARVVALEARQRAFYKKYIDAGGIAIIGDADVHDEHFIQARHAILVMTSKHPKLISEVNPNYYMVLTWKLWQLPHRFVTYWDPNNPEHNEGEYWSWNGHSLVCPPGEACYYARNHPPSCVVNPSGGFCDGFIVVGLSSDGEPLPDHVSARQSPFLTSFIHEFTHLIHGMFETLDPTFRDRLNAAHERAWELNKFLTNHSRHGILEYWAEAVEIWFYNVGEGREKHKNVHYEDYVYPEFDDYEALREFDPLLYDLLDYWFPKVQLPWHY